MVSRDPDITPPAKKTVKGFALHITSKKPGGEITMLGLLVAPSPEKLQETLDFLRFCPRIQVAPAVLTGAEVTLNVPQS